MARGSSSAHGGRQSDGAAMSDTGRPRVSARVSPEVDAMVNRLRTEYPDADGQPGSRSEVVRAILHDGACLMDAELRDGARRAAQPGETMASVWRRIIRAGLANVGNP